MKELIIMLLKIVVYAILPLMVVVALVSFQIAVFVNNVILALVLVLISAMILGFAFMLYVYWLVNIKNIF